MFGFVTLMSMYIHSCVNIPPLIAATTKLISSSRYKACVFNDVGNNFDSKQFKLSKDNVITSCLPCMFKLLKRRIPLVKVVLRPEYESVDLSTL